MAILAADQSMTPADLPIDDVLPEVIARLRNHPNLVIRAPTGAGKTTRAPLAMLQANLAEGQIILVEPRRIAARAAARHMAELAKVQLGQEIGYHVRFDRRAGPATRLLVVTPGMLLQRLHSDPFMDQCGLLVFDEFHERGLDSDLALGFARLLQSTVRPDLKLVAMSATLAAEQVAKYLGGCPIVASDGRLHPVEIRYDPRPATQPPHEAIARAARRLIADTTGDVLVFLPGWSEIRSVMRELEPWAGEKNIVVVPLHGDLSLGEQDAAIGQSSQRRIVLSTNVAETSVTVIGVTGVVDSGLVRELRFDPAVGLDRLQVTSISKASADQRAGRAGRLQQGVCIRLWRESDHRARPDHAAPELLRVDLTGALLQLACHGETGSSTFPWFESPPPAHVETAQNVLRMLDAIDEQGQATLLGRRLARLPLPPRLASMVIAGAHFGHAARVALAAALLAEREPFRRISTSNRAPSESDVLDRVEALEAFARLGQTTSPLGELDRGAANAVLRAADQLCRLADQEGQRSEISADEAVLRSLLIAFPDRLCRRRNPGGRKGVMVGGRGVRLDARSLVTRAQLFLAVEADAAQEESQVRLASAVDRSWLPAAAVSQYEQIEFDERLGKLVLRKESRYFDLVLDETIGPAPPGSAHSEALVAAALAQPERVLPASDSPASRFRTRVRCLNAWRPQLGLPELGDVDCREILRSLAQSCRTLQELRSADWLAAFRGLLTYQQLQALEREAPERFSFPSGRTAVIQYEEDRPPVLASRVQDFFGIAETPRIAGGTVPIQVHLLAPNGRPQQITNDLASFWINTYPLVRKDLRGRYPKHQWPEFPNSPT